MPGALLCGVLESLIIWALCLQGTLFDWGGLLFVFFEKFLKK